MSDAFQASGWRVFAPEVGLSDWVAHARQAAGAALRDPGNKDQFHCGGTWFIGLEALDNDAAGRIAGGPVLGGAAVSFAAAQMGGMPALHAAQLSVVRPGYPKPRAGEADAAFGYRLRRDAAHVDGVLGVGTPKRRYLREPHGFVLGLPLNHASADAAPLVVWHGSHEVIRTAFRDALAGIDPNDWGCVDVTETYQAARKHCFETCARVPVRAEPGGAFVIHRLALHGVAPWGANAEADAEGRMIAYFRPELPGGLSDWLNLP